MNFSDLVQTSPFRIYNAEEPNHPTKIFGGEASGIRAWDDIKYPVFLDYQRSLFGEFWVPEELAFGKDKEQYEQELTEPEQIAYQYSSGALNWLDSIASDVVTLLFLTTSDPSLRTLWSIIASFETMHNVSYEHMNATVMNNQEKQQAFNEIRKIPTLQKRNDHVIEKLDTMTQALSDYLVLGNPKEGMSTDTLQKVFEGLLAYQILEGLYFSGGFVYFHSLARDNKMLESNNLINLIKADENQHSEIFGLVIQILMAENPEINTQENLDYAMNYVKEAVQLEKDWSSWLFEDVDTMTIPEYHDYVEYLANLICRNAGMTEPFPENDTIKSQWITTYGNKKSSEGAITAKADFLQGNSIAYKHEDGGDFDL